MSVKQRKYLELLAVLLCLLVAVWYFQDDEIAARLVFVPAVLYFLMNQRQIRSIEQFMPSPKEIISESRFIRVVTIIILGLEIIVAYWSLATGVRIDGALQGFGMLMLALIGPLLPAVIVSQIRFYKALANQ